MPNGQDANESARTLERTALRKMSAYSGGRDRLRRLWIATDLDARKVVDAVMLALLTLQPPVDVLRWSFGRFLVKGGGSFSQYYAVQSDRRKFAHGRALRLMPPPNSFQRLTVVLQVAWNDERSPALRGGVQMRRSAVRGRTRQALKPRWSLKENEMDRDEMAEKNARSGFANTAELNGSDAAVLNGVTGREDNLGADLASDSKLDIDEPIVPSHEANSRTTMSLEREPRNGGRPERNRRISAPGCEDETEADDFEELPVFDRAGCPSEDSVERR
ncbi:MAG: hypothetical protein JWQ94_4711 [Tardiphaga sp.]|nr:hypothetical protein [Tardiphaga sp.]